MDDIWSDFPKVVRFGWKKKSLCQRQYNCVCEIEYRDERRNPAMNFAHSASRGLHLILGILMKWLIDLLIFCV